jgi:hypothetical protein
VDISLYRTCAFAVAALGGETAGSAVRPRAVPPRARPARGQARQLGADQDHPLVTAMPVSR